MEIIDAHHHLWKYSSHRFPWISSQMDLLKKDYLHNALDLQFKEHHISGSVVVQAVQDEKENHFLINQADKNPLILGIVGWLDLRSPSLKEKLDSYLPFQKLKGFRHLIQDERDPEFILQPDFQRGLDLIFSSGYVYDLLVYPHHLENTVKTVEHFPGAPFVLDHLAKPDIKNGYNGQWEKWIRILAKHEHVYCKISGMVTEASWGNWKEKDFFLYMDVVMDAFGEDRLMFGSDWPVCLLSGSYGEVLDILRQYLNQFPSEVAQKILANNAKDFYRLQTL